MVRRPHAPSPLGTAVSRTGRLVEYFGNEIRGGRYKPLERLPTEQELMQRFDVSRTVVREAIASPRVAPIWRSSSPSIAPSMRRSATPTPTPPGAPRAPIWKPRAIAIAAWPATLPEAGSDQPDRSLDPDSISATSSAGRIGAWAS